MSVTAVLQQSKQYVKSEEGIMAAVEVNSTAKLVLEQAEDMLLTQLNVKQLQEVIRTIVFTKKLLTNIGGVK